MACRYGYNDRINQGEEFVAQLLQKVLEVLYINLRDAVAGKSVDNSRTSIDYSGMQARLVHIEGIKH